MEIPQTLRELSLNIDLNHCTNMAYRKYRIRTTLYLQRFKWVMERITKFSQDLMMMLI